MLTTSFDSGFHPYLYGKGLDSKCYVLEDVQSVKYKGCVGGHSCETLKALRLYKSDCEFDLSESITEAYFEIEGFADWLASLGSAQFSGDSLVLYAGDFSLSLLIECDANSGYGATFYASNFSVCNTAELQDLIIHPIQSFAAFLFGDYPAVQKLRIQLSDKQNLIEVVSATSAGLKGAKLNNSAVPLSLRALGGLDGLKLLLSKWLELKGDQRYGATVLTSLLISWDMPVELLFFAGNMALEALGRSFLDDCYSKEQVKELIGPMLEATPAEIKDRVRSLLTNLLPKPSYGMILNEAYSRAGEYGVRLIPKWKCFLDEQCIMRIKGAHGFGQDFGIETIVDHCDAQLILSYILVMKILGCSDAVFQSFWNSNFRNRSRWRIAQHYAVTEKDKA